MWEWVSERKMGLVSRSVRSRRFPFTQISNFVVQSEQLRMMQYLYSLTDEDLLMDRSRDWDTLSRGEMMDQELSEFLFGL
jgi:hypothetical protein